jgi:hypothetical protein
MTAHDGVLVATSGGHVPFDTGIEYALEVCAASVDVRQPASQQGGRTTYVNLVTSFAQGAKLPVDMRHRGWGP